MANAPIVTRTSIALVKKATAGTLPIGCGVNLSGTYSADNFPLVDFPTVPDGLASGVIYEIAPTDSTVGSMVQVGLSNVQIRIGSVGVTAGDKIDLQDNTGVWRKAPMDAVRVYYVALESASAGALCWATPIAGCVIPPTNVINKTLQIVTARVTSDQTTTSSTLVDLTGPSITITIASGSKVKIDTSFSLSNTSALGSTANIVLDVDGSTDTGAGQTTPGLTGALQTGSINRLITGLSAGSHTFKLRWNTTAGTARCRPVTAPSSEHASIVVTEIGN